IVHEKLYDEMLERLGKAYQQIESRVGEPLLKENVLYGPLHTKKSVQMYVDVLQDVKKQGGHIYYGGKVLKGDGNFVEPTIVTNLSHDAD
ncbi:unnamed protein product, partial [Didymodactylos carnosus]